MPDGNAAPRSRAPRTIASARGCSLPLSRLAARWSSSASLVPRSRRPVTTAESTGLPRVSVPVLSTTKVSTFSMRSSASAFFTSTPARAPRPMPTMMAMGVARPSAHGHAMMSTDTALTSACAKRGGGPTTLHTTNVITAMSTTAGTKYEATTSARRWMRARLRWASLTIRTIRASKVPCPTRSARIVNPPEPFTVPPVTALLGPFSAGIASPVSMDSSTALVPSTTTPSTGIFSPGLTRNVSPATTPSSGASSSLPSARTTRAVFGVRPRRARRALLVWLRARSSRTCPSKTSTVMTAAGSKYTAGAPPCPRNSGGSNAGNRVAITL